MYFSLLRLCTLNREPYMSIAEHCGHGTVFPWQRLSMALARRKDRASGTRSNLWFVVVFLAFLVMFGGGIGDASDRLSPPRGIVLVTIDALRADHLRCYGYDRNTSPFIDTIAQQGVLFTNAYATSSWTVPSMASIFTGLYPKNHGVRHGVSRQGEVYNQQVLPRDLPNLTALLKEDGYTTVGISSNLHMSKNTGFARGFDHFILRRYGRASSMNEALQSVLEEIESARRWFLWIHYFDPHDPYFFRRPWAESYCTDREICQEISNEEMAMQRLRALHQSGELEGKLPRALRSLYDSEINYCDEHLKLALQALPGFEDSLLIITSDHGEEFDDHGGLGHGTSLYEELVRVPLIVRFPGARHAGVRIDHQVSIVDILPTIVEALGLKVPQTADGESLVRLIEGHETEEGTTPRKEIYMELDRKFKGEAVRSENLKLIDIRSPVTGIALFDIEEDSEEKFNIAGLRPHDVERLFKALRNFVESPTLARETETSPPLSREDLDVLRSLGYIR
jgi:arylsulfatase A-like enzyme